MLEQSQQILNKKRDDFMKTIRKQYKEQLFKRRRTQFQQKQNNIYSKYLVRIRNLKEINYQLLDDLINLTKSNEPNSFILLGNYILDYLNLASNYVFPFMKKYSNCPYYSWVIRLVLEASDHNKQQYLQHIDKFISSQDKRIILHGLQCVNYLIQNQLYSTILNLRHLDQIFKNHFYSPDVKLRFHSIHIFINLLKNNSEIRQKYCNIKLHEQILNLLRQNKKYRRLCLDLLNVLAKKLCLEVFSNEVIKQLIFLSITQDIGGRQLISSIWFTSIKNFNINNITQLLNNGLKDSLCQQLKQNQSKQLTKITLRILQSLYDRLQMEGQYKLYDKLLIYFQQHYNLSSIIDSLIQNQNAQISELAQNIINCYYSYQVDEELNIIEKNY